METGFLQTIESIQAERASVERIFQGDGQRVRGLARTTPQYMHRLAEAAKLVAGVLAGTRPVYLLEAALSTSDFPLLFADILDRQVLAAYREWTPTWPAIAQRRTVRDFRTAKIYPPAYGADSRLVEVAQLAEYPESTITEQAATTLTVKKYGRRIGFSWEAMINDDLDQLKNIPTRFAAAARRTEQLAVTELYVDASGPHASLYTGGNLNIVTSNPPLSIAALQTAMTVLAAMKGENGEPILIETVTLVVPPALEITARNILNALQLELTTAGGVRDGGTGEQRLIVQNWMRNKLNLVVDPYIPVTASSANGNTSWFLFANPNEGRPALTIAFLRGHEEPEIFIKDPDARRAGGGQADPMDGSFDNDSVDYKVRHVLGVARISPKVTVASNGSGS
jgi:hypothetical protein